MSHKGNPLWWMPWPQDEPGEKHAWRDFKKMRIEPGKERKDSQELEGGYERSGTISGGRTTERMPGNNRRNRFPRSLLSAFGVLNITIFI